MALCHVVEYAPPTPERKRGGVIGGIDEVQEINLGLIEGQPSLKKKVNCWKT